MAFNIILHVIFLKLSTELDSLNIFAFNIIVATILFNYIFVAILSGNGIGSILDPDLVGVGTRSFAFNLSSVVYLIGISLFIVAVEGFPRRVSTTLEGMKQKEDAT